MKKKLKYNFLHIIPLHYSIFYNSFLLCCALSCHFFCYIECLTRATENHFIRRREKLKKRNLLYKKSIFSSKKKVLQSCHFVSRPFQRKNLVMTKKLITFNQCPNFLAQILNED